MCDYSLHLVTSRPAKVGDKLVSTKFTNSITRGSPQSENQTWQCAFFPAPSSHSRTM